jgi:hypothetical protein
MNQSLEKIGEIWKFDIGLTERAPSNQTPPVRAVSTILSDPIYVFIRVNCF